MAIYRYECDPTIITKSELLQHTVVSLLNDLVFLNKQNERMFQWLIYNTINPSQRPLPPYLLLLYLTSVEQKNTNNAPRAGFKHRHSRHVPMLAHPGARTQ